MRLRLFTLLWVLLIALSGCTSSLDDPDPQQTPRLSLPEAILLPEPYGDIVVDIHYVDGRAPAETTLAALVEALNTVAEKRHVDLRGPNTVDGVVGDPEREWGLATVLGVHERTRSISLPAGAYGAEGKAYLHVLFLDGQWRDERGAARGVQINNVLAIFPDTLKPSHMLLETDGTRFPNHAALEERLLLHELGHAFGLVDCGIPMVAPRESASSSCHSVNEDTVMRPVDALDMAVNNVHEDLGIGRWYDADDLQDIRTFRESAER